MAEVGLRYDELDNQVAKEAALKAFIAFYIHQYRLKSLEIMGAKASNEVMGTINHVLKENSYHGAEELAEISERLCKPAYEEVLSELTDVKFNQEGQPIVPLEKLWQKEEEQLPKED
ncbi:MAG: DUF3368 domain-containing protein [Limosilactobacillus vaginalis]|nr:DUF3368 domain-containing protein [Limosilactobacillus vaginalis]